MTDLNSIKQVMKKISSVKELYGHICFFGGATPYIITNQESNRQHSDIDVLVDEEYMPIIREIVKNNNIKIEADSLDLNLDDDYGLKVYINNVYVEFEPMSIKNNLFVRKSFSPNKKICGVETIPYIDINDLIIPIQIDEIPTYSESLELTKFTKEKYAREKDLQDVAFINQIGINQERFIRIKQLYENYNTQMNSYDYHMKK